MKKAAEKNDQLKKAAQANRWLKIPEIKNFAERVTMAGVKEAFESETIWERKIWAWVLVIALIFMVANAAVLGKRYADDPREIVFNDMDIVGEQAPFPKITICVPKMFNKSRAREILVIPEPVRDFMSKWRISV